MTRPATPPPPPPQSKEALVPPQPKETLGVVSTLKTGLGVVTSGFKVGISALSFFTGLILLGFRAGVKKLFGIDIGDAASKCFGATESLGKGTFSPFVKAPKMLYNQVDNVVMGRDHNMHPVSVGFEGLAEISDRQVTADSSPGPSPDFEPVSAAPIGAGHEAGRAAGA